MTEFKKKIVCVDLETTHLDFKEGRIMEVAAIKGEIFFDQKKSKVVLKFEEEFDFLVNPEIEVPMIAQQLTGIKIDDLERSSAWKDVKVKFDEFIKDEIVVGHNIDFDLGYLENQGSRLKNEFIDTLELSQTLLPVTASHSLEALAENLGVQIGISHRALEDCKTSALVLVELLNQFLMLPLDVQEQIRPLLSGSASLALLKDLPRVVVKGVSVQKKQPSSIEQLKLDFPYDDKILYSLPITFSRHSDLLSHLATQSESMVVGVSNRLYLDGLPDDQIIVGPDRALCMIKFNQFVTNDKLNLTAKRIIAKILVYLHYNQSLDLGKVTFNPNERNWTGRLMVDTVSCLEHRCKYFDQLQIKTKKNRFVDLRSLFELQNSWKLDLSNNRVLLFDLAEIEESLISSQSTHLTLQKAREILGVVYPVDDSGLNFLNKIPKEATAFLNELDLFFGILHLVFLKRKGEYSETLVLSGGERESERFQKMVSPAEKLLVKVDEFLNQLQSKTSLESGEVALQMKTVQRKLIKFKNLISELFVNPNSELIYWLKFNSEWVDLNSAPRDLKIYVSNFINVVRSVAFVDTEMPEKTFEYFSSRLGIEGFEQQDLMKEAIKSRVSVKFLPNEFAPDELGKIISTKNRSSIVIVSNVTQLLKFFEFFTQDETLSSRLVSYKYSGGLGNVRRKLRNLSNESKPFIFLLTTNAAIRFFREFPKALDLYIQKIPFEAPSAASPARKKLVTQSDFMDNALPRALYNLNLLITRFVSEQSEKSEQKIYLGDRRISTDYDKAFLQYLQNLSGVEVEL